MEFLLAGLAGHDLGRGLQILDAAGDIGIAGGAAGLAVILMVHGPAIEAMAGELVHHRIFAIARHVEIEHPRGHRRAMHEEQHRPRRLARTSARPAACGTSTAARRPSWPSIRCSRSRRLPKAARWRLALSPCPTLRQRRRPHQGLHPSTACAVRVCDRDGSFSSPRLQIVVRRQRSRSASRLRDDGSSVDCGGTAQLTGCHGSRRPDGMAGAIFPVERDQGEFTRSSDAGTQFRNPRENCSTNPSHRSICCSCATPGGCRRFRKTKSRTGP